MNRAKEIFLSAIELSDERQAQFVAEQCAGDEPLRAEVQQMLRLHRTPQLNRPAARPAETIAIPAPPMRRDANAGDTIGRYRLVRPLGEGGFGSVFLAQQTEPVVRDVALKLIRRGMDTDQVIARFTLERQALAMMDHPGIARVFDAGATDTGQPYFVMEYVDGPPITQYCRDNNLDINQRLELIEQVCLAVQHAHTRGVIHRDLKPGNILVTRVDQRPVPKVIDFGVAKATDAQMPGSSAMTLEVQIVGTPQYMAPEQARAGATQIDTRTDVYSIGTVLYELITGTAPFDPEKLRSSGIEAMCQKIREETPPRPSTRIVSRLAAEAAAVTADLRLIRRQISGEIDWIVMRALEKDPALRYQSPAEFAADIRRHLSHEAVLAGPPSRLYQFRKFARRHRKSLAVAATIVLLLLGATIVSGVLAQRARRAESDARRQTARAEEELARANAIVGFTGDLLGGITPAVARGRDTALLRDLLDRSIEKAHSSLAGQPKIALAVRNIIGKALDDLGDPSAALKELQEIYDSTATGELRDDPERIRAGIAIANICIMQFDAPGAQRVIEQVQESIRRAGLEESDLGYEAKICQGGAQLRQARPELAEPYFRQVVDHYRSHGQIESNIAMRAGNDLAGVLSMLGRFEESNQLWSEMYEIERRRYGEDHPSTLMTMMDIGTSFQRQNKLEDAEKWMRDALQSARKIFPPGHTTLLINMNNLASLLMYQSRLDEAELILVEGYETGRTKLAMFETPLDVIMLNLSRVRSRQKRHDEALELSSALHKAIAQKNGSHHPRPISLLSYLFEDYANAGRAAEGIAVLRELGEMPGDTQPEIRQRLEAAIGKMYLSNGDEFEARRRAALSRSAAPPQNGRVPLILRELESALHIEPTTTTSGRS